MYDFQRAFRRALLKYALLPALLFGGISLIFTIYAWNHYVVANNLAVRSELVHRLEGGLQDGASVLQQMEHRIQAGSGALAPQSNQDRSALYGDLYAVANQSAVPLDFYLLDEQGQLLLGSQPVLPSGLQHGDWGILRRLHQSSRPCWEFIRKDMARQDLALGKAVAAGDGGKGVLVIIISGDKIFAGKENPEVLLAVTDSFDNVTAAAEAMPVDEQGKLLPILCATDGGLAEAGREIYYVTQSRLPQGLQVVALTPVRSLLDRYLMGSALSLLFFLLLIPLIFRGVQRESQLRAQAVERLTAKAEMRQLESQFNPHFLFNTLENIKYMVKLDPAAAIRMLIALSALLRYSINNSLQQVTLADDLDYVHRYMEIQQYRFGKRLDFTENIDSAALACEIPKLLFQPLLENAIKYGADKSGLRSVRLEIKCLDDELQVDVVDQGRGFSAETLQAWHLLQENEENDTAHTGLYNIHRRIQLFYGRQFGVEIRSGAGENCVRLRLPRRVAEEGLI
ncbi:sensor histidine kinase [Selenomonas ruminantium]|uniref:Histidine kinase-, DNA gyrase B-, and HSP90-like ATPase n=1 Tax=Selenomonas ruminantium TaxID=971 RepID=A0A1H0S8B4_SELRU|nr:histidine kinase [Selenomonas ruminantium]SDP37974.1 Histidine kinase-, DNA gyrase B-, and HSP90-like ATPase [Selenomonas ruminantium]